MIGVGAAVVLTVAVLLWSKWVPYAARTVQLSTTGSWRGTSILAAGGVRPGDAPSWHAATSFTAVYAAAVWKALVAALLISAATQTLVPRGWLVRALDRRGRLRSALVGGLTSMPSMMCTCCTAPVAVSLRRVGAPTAATVAYWLGNPLLNPAVLVFLVLVAPWQWLATRVVVSLVLVVAGAAVVSWLCDRPGLAETANHERSQRQPRSRPAAVEFARALARTSAVLVPEYLVVVMVVGAFRGWLFPIGPGAGSWVALAVVLAAVVGTLVVIPTGGEIPILQGLALAGLSTGVLGALLVTLPAVSLPGIAMVGRAFGWRVTAATSVVVMLGGLAGAAVLGLL